MSFAPFLPDVKVRPSTISHPVRTATWGIVIHWTAGREPGDVATLDGPNVDVQFYVAKDGDIYQFLPLDSQAWHGYSTANRNTIGIEVENLTGEPWTAQQFASLVRLSAALSLKYGIPVRKVDPVRDYPDGTNPPPADWYGFFGHKDLAGIDGNNHTDTVPDGTGWNRFLTAVADARKPPYGPPFPIFAKSGVVYQQIANADLTNATAVFRMSRALRAAGKTPPYRVTDHTGHVATGKFWGLTGPNEAFVNQLRVPLSKGRDLSVEGVVTIKARRS